MTVIVPPRHRLVEAEAAVKKETRAIGRAVETCEEHRRRWSIGPTVLWTRFVTLYAPDRERNQLDSHSRRPSATEGSRWTLAPPIATTRTWWNTTPVSWQPVQYSGICTIFFLDDCPLIFAFTFYIFFGASLEFFAFVALSFLWLRWS